ncbi:hypothetical protein ACH47B_25340 [Rhodococcus sp. NPDC019627]|uniref:DUF5709 domain-containing protein n=1 Tax=Rhodococcus oxybenzonivorans TaxID=1990687 RepID=A0A2S2BT97_9NOCA|nr:MULTISPECIES: hypothetical protein [Rhodococcus]AWK71850.1 hypothetical protein CBI38_09885 [Rhodococcus oxybenzonivorans]MDV7353450.1 hypothetical protein [Rhodococcus oxybenzonivorans]QTJ65211.1 hypothetical protein HYG77_06065 [Rhodococcus sp. ZPP]
MSIEDGPGETLSPSESLDSDDVRNNDGDDVVDPPDGWSEADKFGTTAREEREGESLDEKLAEEEPDIAFEEQLDIPIAELPDDQLSEDVDRIIDGEDDIVIPVLGTKHADVVEGVIVEDSRTDRGQIDGAAEDGDSFFTVVD